MKHLALVAAVMAALSSAAEGQHPDHVAVHPGLALWEGGNPHAGVAVTWRKNIWRNWGLNAGYILTTSLDHYQHHYDNIVWVGAERSFGSSGRERALRGSWGLSPAATTPSTVAGGGSSPARGSVPASGTGTRSGLGSLRQRCSSP